MQAFTAMTLSGVGGQDRPRRRTLGFLRHWRLAVAATALVALLLAAALSHRRWLDLLAAAVTGAVAVSTTMRVRARRVQERVALTKDENDGTAMLDLGGAARASTSLEGFLDNVAMRMATATKASSVSILLRDGV